MQPVLGDLHVVAQPTDGFAVRGHIELQELAMFRLRAEAGRFVEVRKDVDMRVHHRGHSA